MTITRTQEQNRKYALNRRDRIDRHCPICGVSIWHTAVTCRHHKGQSAQIAAIDPALYAYYLKNKLAKQESRERTLKRIDNHCLTCRIRIEPSARYCPKHYYKKGPNHHAWKGGRLINSAGYIRIYAPEHPRSTINGHVLEHILVWEQVHGKPLPKTWIVHHLNGIKHDNRPENLSGLPDAKHHHVLAAKAKRIQELEALLNKQGQLI